MGHHGRVHRHGRVAATMALGGLWPGHGRVPAPLHFGAFALAHGFCFGSSILGLFGLLVYYLV